MKTLKAAPSRVVSNVLEYFKSVPNYKVVSVICKHPESVLDNDSNLFFVIAKGHNPYTVGQFSCWSCWNDSTRSLNYGHYWHTLSECFELACEHCESSTDVSGKTASFIKSDKDLIEMPDHLNCSFVVNTSNGYTLEDSDLLVLAINNMEE